MKFPDGGRADEMKQMLSWLPEEAVGQTVFMYPYRFNYPRTPPRRSEAKACKVKSSGS